VTDRPTAIIADDEETLRDYLQRRLSEVWPELRIIHLARNGLEAVELIERERPDIAFLDIKMPGLTGIEVASRTLTQCHLVFVTSYDDYAVEAFEREAIDYLVKPVSAERLGKTVERLKARIASKQQPATDLSGMMEALLAQLPSPAPSRYLKWVRVPKGEGVRLIAVDDVLCFKAADKYTLVYSAAGEALINLPIKALAEQLDPDHFWQIHRSTLVRVDAIEQVGRSLTGRYQVKLRGVSEPFIVSRTYASQFKQM
jgi:DNA-binding LytR/AlgR family response regulator